MFTIAQIKLAHAKVKSGADFPAYISEIKALGVAGYDNFVSDGANVYFGAGIQVSSDPKYDSLTISANPSVDALKSALKIHQEGQTDYLTFCRQSADAGVEKWTVDILTMTCSYFDRNGNVMVVEVIPG